MVDWGAGRYEVAAAELAPVAQVVVEQAAISAGEDVVDVACGTGNAALLAAECGARVVGVDGAARLLDVARERAREKGVIVDLREGDLLALPVADDAADVVLSVFGVIFADKPEEALRELQRILRPAGRALVTAWVPAGPIDAMLGAMRRIVARVGPAQPPIRFAWSDPDVLAPVAAKAGLALKGTTPAELAIRAASPEDYVAAGQDHPMAVRMRPLVEQAGVAQEIRDVTTTILRDANQDPNGFLVHSPYVVHDLRIA